MDRYAVALVLEEIAVLLELHGANRFKARAFRQAARSVERLDGDIAALVRSGEIDAVRGVGPATAGVVRELVARGAARLHRDLLARTPAGMFELLALPGLGPHRIAALHEHIGVASLDDLERALAQGTVADVPGFGEKTQAALRTGITFVRGGSGRRRRPQALEAALRIRGVLAALPAVARVEFAGELRRGCETVGSLPLVVAAPAAAHAEVRAAFGALPGGTARLPADGTDGDGAGDGELRFADGFAVRLRCVEPASFGDAWLEETGSAAHLAALRAASRQRGVTSGGHAAEAELYAELGMSWIPPELREGGAELEAATRGTLPQLVSYEELRGCLHCHTTYSDGTATVEEIARGGIERGWRYIGIADHSEAAGYAGGLTPADIARQHDEIDRWNETEGERLWLFKGIEADILADGTLDYARHEGLLERFDYVIGSIHSRFRADRAALTERVLTALDDPRLTVLGHPTGRMLLSRDAYDIDLEAVIARAGERGVAIEINADPRRLELDWRWWPQATRHGVRCAINPDAHSVAGLDNVRYGVAIARKGWLTTADVMTAWELDALRAHFARRREAAHDR